MGIKEFWPTFGGGDVVNLFDLASKHIQDTGKPYRIAVDLPYWSFHNLNDISAQRIRQVSQRASQPIEKAVLYRMMRLAIHGIQIVLVVDGPERPPKKNRITIQGYSSITERLSLLKSTAKVLGIPWWQAPGEAEAECAQMQRLGLVDAVWSEDSDTFLFKGTTMFRFHMEDNGSKSNTHVRSQCMDKIAEKARGMDWRDLVLFAIIVGGDYDPKGLMQCGPKLALEAIRQGYGISLVRAFENGDMTAWRQKFKQFLEQQNHIPPPIGFPSMQLLRDYIKPKVSSEQELRSGLSWCLEVDNTALRSFITSRYNFSVQENINWVVRMLLTRRLLLRDRLDELAVEYVRSVSCKESGNIPMSRISFLLLGIMPRQLLESWPVKITKAASRIKPYEHVDRIECDIPNSIAKLALPDLEDLQKRPATKVPAEVPTQPKGQGYDQAAVGKRKRGRPRKDANNTVATRIPLKDTDHEKLKEKRKGQYLTDLERSVGHRSGTTLSKGASSASQHFHPSKPPLLSPQAEQYDDDFSDEEFPDLRDLGQQRRMKYIKETPPLDKATSSDLADVTLQDTDHKQNGTSEPNTAAVCASMHNTIAEASQLWESSRLSSNVAASASQDPSGHSGVGHSLSQVIDLTEDWKRV